MIILDCRPDKIDVIYAEELTVIRREVDIIERALHLYIELG